MNQRQKNLWTGTCSLLLANLAILQVTADLFSYESRAEVWQSSLCEETGHLLFLFLVLVPVIHDWTLLALANAVNGVGLFLLVATWQPVASQLLLSRERYIEVSLGTGPIAIGSGSEITAHRHSCLAPRFIATTFFLSIATLFLVSATLSLFSATLSLVLLPLNQRHFWNKWYSIWIESSFQALATGLCSIPVSHSIQKIQVVKFNPLR